ncbi:MAG: hypothetical protein GYB67_07545, partial [Chloroflexi bacterium]|nr:hypothetical protein [Chloroflexota bacterium]
VGQPPPDTLDPNQRPSPLGQSSGSPSSVATLALPMLSPDEVRTAVEAGSEDPGVYLAAARYAAENNDAELATNMLAVGGDFADDPAGYWVTAIDIAAEADNAHMAVALANQILLAAERQDYYPTVYSTLGEALYRAALTPGNFDFEGVRDLVESFRNAHPLVRTMIARALITFDRLIAFQSAENVLEAILNTDIPMQEARLVLGELYAARGDSEAARLEWEAVLEGDRVSPWLRDRARALLAELPR